MKKLMIPLLIVGIIGLIFSLLVITLTQLQGAESEMYYNIQEIKETYNTKDVKILFYTKLQDIPQNEPQTSTYYIVCLVNGKKKELIMSFEYKQSGASKFIDDLLFPQDIIGEIELKEVEVGNEINS